MTASDRAADEIASMKAELISTVRRIVGASTMLDVNDVTLRADLERLQGGTSDLIVCFDALPRLTDAEDYQTTVARLTEFPVTLLLSGLDFPPMSDMGHLNFFEALSSSLVARNFMPFPLASYNGLSVVAAIPSASISPRDISSKTLTTAIDVAASPKLLLESVVRSRALLGFFPDHLPRCIEYPWVVDHLPRVENRRVVDVGAGVSVLPFMMADRGHRVLTVDPHPAVRYLEDKASWTEWGYLDYSKIDDRIASLHLAYQDAAEEMTVDAVVSVSVVEHLPCEVRRQCIRKAHRQLVPGGTLLLTVDTEPFSQRLWNYSEGRRVDSSDIHGTVSDLAREVTEAGFELQSVEIQDRVPLARVGMARIVAQKPM